MVSSSTTSTSKSMAMALAFFFFLLLASVGSSSASVYTVGGAKGWTAKSPPNYTALAATVTFHVGDTLMFVYHKEIHNVVEVMKSDYDACTASSPIETYHTGNDSVTIATAGAHYFLCSVPNHCNLGQKIEISAAGNGSSAVPEPAPNAAVGRSGTVGLVVLSLVLAALLSALEFGVQFISIY